VSEEHLEFKRLWEKVVLVDHRITEYIKTRRCLERAVKYFRCCRGGNSTCPGQLVRAGLPWKEQHLERRLSESPGCHRSLQAARGGTLAQSCPVTPKYFY